ncbi:GNAT family N-acetyltransferase [Vibrio atlanticus]|nr:GNAT family N-acetyltransferase [Vibrio atlanticus]
MNIQGKLVTLRAIEIGDLPFLHQWSNDPEIWEGLGGWHFPYSSLTTESWIVNISKSTDSFVFAIEDDSKDLIGTISLTNIDWKNRKAFYGIMIGNKSKRGQGLAQDSVEALLKYAFYELGLMRIESDIVEFNLRSIKFHKSMGWKFEGVKEKSYFSNGKFHNQMQIAFLSDFLVQKVD